MGDLIKGIGPLNPQRFRGDKRLMLDGVNLELSPDLAKESSVARVLHLMTQSLLWFQTTAHTYRIVRCWSAAKANNSSDRSMDFFYALHFSNGTKTIDITGI